MGPAKAKNCENIPQILERIQLIKRTKEILNQMGNTASFEDATMIDHLRMSITTGDSMTPAPFLKIFTGLMSTTDSTTTFKTFASCFKAALIQHGNTFGLPLYESTSSTTTMAANAVASSGNKPSSREPALVVAARTVAYKMRDVQALHNCGIEDKFCHLCLTVDHSTYTCPHARTLFKEAGCKGKWTDSRLENYKPAVSLDEYNDLISLEER